MSANTNKVAWLAASLFIGFPTLATALEASSAINVVTNLHFKPIGSFTGDAGLHVEEIEADKILTVSFDFYIGSILSTNSLADEVSSFPSEQLSIWVLYGQSQALELLDKWPPSGRSPAGYGKSGTGQGLVTYKFRNTCTNTLTAVVVKLSDEYRVVPLNKIAILQKPDRPR